MTDPTPLSSDERVPRRVVCAAVKLRNGVVVCGVRHFDELMRMAIDEMGKPDKLLPGAEQGFVDNRYQFLSRAEAWHLALDAKQIDIESPSYRGIRGSLFSEDLY